MTRTSKLLKDYLGHFIFHITMPHNRFHLLFPFHFQGSTNKFIYLTAEYTPIATLRPPKFQCSVPIQDKYINMQEMFICGSYKWQGFPLSHSGLAHLKKLKKKYRNEHQVLMIPNEERFIYKQKYMPHICQKDEMYSMFSYIVTLLIFAVNKCPENCYLKPVSEILIDWDL